MIGHYSKSVVASASAPKQKRRIKTTQSAGEKAALLLSGATVLCRRCVGFRRGRLPDAGTKCTVHFLVDVEYCNIWNEFEANYQTKLLIPHG